MSEKIKKSLSFEEAFARLIKISQELENENIGLEESVKLYEESVQIKKFCEDFITKTKLRIEKINKSEDSGVQNED